VLSAFVLLFAQGITTVGFGLLMRFVLLDIPGAPWWAITALLVVFVLWASTLVLMALFAKPLSLYFIGLSFAVAAFLALFDVHAWHWFIAVIVITLLAGGYFRWRVQTEKILLQHLHLRRIIPRTLPRFFTVVALAIAILFYASPQFGHDEKIEYTIPRSMFDTIVYPLLAPVIETNLNQGLADTGLHIDPFGSINFEELGIDINQLPENLRVLLPKGLNTGDNLFTRDLIYSALNQQLNLTLGTFDVSRFKILPAFVAVGLFLGIKALSIPLTWAIIPVTAGIIKLLLFTGILRKETKQVQVETINLMHG